MKRLLSCLLVLCMALGLCAFTAPSASPAPTAPVFPTPEPTPGPWLQGYRRLISNAAAREKAIGAAADYRSFYFSYDPSLLEPSAYALADLNDDEVPELLLYAEGTGLTDVFTWDGGLRYLGYDAYFGFVPELGAAVVHGHWHGAGGSGAHEYSVPDLFGGEDARAVYFDYLENDEGERRYSVYDGKDSYNGDWAEAGRDKKGEKLYRELYGRCVLECVRLEDIPFFAMDNPEGLEKPCDLKIMPPFRTALGTFPYTAEEFLTRRGWEAPGLAFGEEKAVRGLFFDLDGDGLDELLLLNGLKGERQRCYVYRYDAAGDKLLKFGEGPLEPYVASGALYGRSGEGEDAVWTAWRKAQLALRSSELDGIAAEYMERWETPERLRWQSINALTAVFTGEVFNTDELARAAADYYERHSGFRPPEAEVLANPDGTWTVHLFEIVDEGGGRTHTATSAWYTVDEFGIGTDDLFGTPVDFSE